MGIEGGDFIGNPYKINEFVDELDLDINEDEPGFGVLFTEETEDIEEEEEDYDYDIDFSLYEVGSDDYDSDVDDDDGELRMVSINGTYVQLSRGTHRENVEQAAAASSENPEEVVNDIDNNEIVKSSVSDGTGSANDSGGNDTQPLPPEGTV